MIQLVIETYVKYWYCICMHGYDFGPVHIGVVIWCMFVRGGAAPEFTDVPPSHQSCLLVWLDFSQRDARAPAWIATVRLAC